MAINKDPQLKQTQPPTLNQLAEQYDFRKDLKDGMYLDARDTSQTWCFAQAVKVTAPYSVRIHYEGWGEKYDEVKNIHHML